MLKENRAAEEITIINQMAKQDLDLYVSFGCIKNAAQLHSIYFF